MKSSWDGVAGRVGQSRVRAALFTIGSVMLHLKHEFKVKTVHLLQDECHFDVMPLLLQHKLHLDAMLPPEYELSVNLILHLKHVFIINAMPLQHELRADVMTLLQDRLNLDAITPHEMLSEWM